MLQIKKFNVFKVELCAGAPAAGVLPEVRRFSVRQAGGRSWDLGSGYRYLYLVKFELGIRITKKTSMTISKNYGIMLWTRHWNIKLHICQCVVKLPLISHLGIYSLIFSVWIIIITAYSLSNVRTVNQLEPKNRRFHTTNLKRYIINRLVFIVGRLLDLFF